MVLREGDHLTFEGGVGDFEKNPGTIIVPNKIHADDHCQKNYSRTFSALERYMLHGENNIIKGLKNIRACSLSPAPLQNKNGPP